MKSGGNMGISKGTHFSEVSKKYLNTGLICSITKLFKVKITFFLYKIH